MSDIYIVRHGETSGESSVRLYGKTNIGLSDSGREQMRLAGNHLEHIPFKQVFVSPLSRSQESARIMLSGRGPEPEVVAGFREISFGDWEGWTLDEAAERDPENYMEWKKGSVDFQFPGGDRKSEFFLKKAAAANETFSDCQLPALAVLHKGVIKGVLSALLNLSLDEVSPMHIELGSIHHLQRNENSSWTLIATNETSHLGDTRIPSSR